VAPLRYKERGRLTAEITVGGKEKVFAEGIRSRTLPEGKWNAAFDGRKRTRTRSWIKKNPEKKRRSIVGGRGSPRKKRGNCGDIRL